jgi:hypothetical protein
LPEGSPADQEQESLDEYENDPLNEPAENLSLNSRTWPEDETGPTNLAASAAD